MSLAKVRNAGGGARPPLVAPLERIETDDVINAVSLHMKTAGRLQADSNLVHFNAPHLFYYIIIFSRKY